MADCLFFLNDKETSTLPVKDCKIWAFYITYTDTFYLFTSSFMHVWHCINFNLIHVHVCCINLSRIKRIQEGGMSYSKAFSRTLFLVLKFDYITIKPFTLQAKNILMSMYVQIISSVFSFVSRAGADPGILVRGGVEFFFQRHGIWGPL